MIVAGFVLLFMYTGFSKLSALRAFQQVMSESEQLQHHAAWLAWVVPVCNLVAAALLVTLRTRSKGLWFALALLLLFTGYIVWMLFCSAPLPCSCGGITSYLSWKQHFLLNIGLVGLLLFAIHAEKTRTVFR